MRNVLVAIVAVLLGASHVDASPPGRSAPSARVKTRPRPAPVKPKTPRVEPAAVLLRYQRVGRELLELQNLRGAFLCTDLWLDFRAIKLSEAMSTPESRVDTLDELVYLHDRIERMKGMDVTRECLANPLAESCK
ncbi:MAG TPA: hypothetical protein VLB44_22440 [Kofleriaceae bacterium]|nr:hypothetical protein [Kofleriaceae bacterium]